MSEFKEVIFFVALLFGVPAGIILAYSNKFVERIVIFLMMFFTCNLSFTINFETVKDYRGTSRGYEIGVVDLTALIIFGVMILKPKFKIKLFPPGSLLYAVYLGFSILSIQNSANTMYSWWEVLKMIKMFFFYMVLYNYFTDFGQIRKFLQVMPFLVVYMFMMVLYQWRMGIYQPYGPFTHQNSLAMYLMTIGSIFLAALLEIRLKQFKLIYVTGIFGLCCLIEVMTLSRAGVVCYAGACSIVVFFSFMIKFKPRKVAIFMFMFLVALGGLLFYANSIYERFMYAPESSMESRKNLAASARNMANDKDCGIGLNNFGIKVNAEYPYSKHYMPEGFKEGLVESVYLMIAAETGWFNMYVYIIMIAYFYIINIVNIRRYRRSKLVYLPIGLAGGLAAIYAQSYLEWVLKQAPNYYQLMLFFAMITAMAKFYKDYAKLNEEERLAMEAGINDF